MMRYKEGDENFDRTFEKFLNGVVYPEDLTDEENEKRCNKYWFDLNSSDHPDEQEIKNERDKNKQILIFGENNE